jgi:cell division protein FtsZ
MGNRLSVTLISSLATEEESATAPAKPASFIEPQSIPVQEEESVAPPVPPIWEQREEPAAVAAPPAFVDELVEIEEPAVGIEAGPPPTAYVQEEPAIEETLPQPRVILPKKKPVLFKEPKPVEEKKLHAKQEVLQFEPLTRGRFEKSEPTIVEGQDLDIPTFLRKNVRVK